MEKRVAIRWSRVILSFRVSRVCDLRFPVLDSVRDGKPEVLDGTFQAVGLLPDRGGAER
jgi:hypothetical protein